MSNNAIRLPEDNSYRHEFFLTDNNGDPIDLTDGEVVILVSTKRTKVLTYTWTVADMLQIVGSPVDGVVGLRLLPDTVAPGTYTLLCRYTLDDDVWEDNGPDLMVFAR